MQFGRVPLSRARGAILAHGIRAGERRLRKGRILSEDDMAALADAAIEEIAVARLDADDIGEDEAAIRVARLCANGDIRTGAAFTGRVNIYAGTAGLAWIDIDKVAAINAIHESVTVATLAPFTRVVRDRMLATVKIIPFAAPRTAVESIENLLLDGAIVSVAPFAPRNAALVSTVLPDTGHSILDKNKSAIENRLLALGSKLVFERRVAHEDAAVSNAICEALAVGADPILVFGASAITDRRDVIPAAIMRAGGVIERFGMPVDPGNLLLLGRIKETRVIGLPGCSRSPKRNGFDFVLERICANVAIAVDDIAAMGVGGLLTEISTRPHPREQTSADMPRAKTIAAIVLAAGLSSRMGRNKLTVALDHKPLLRHVVEAAIRSHVSDVIVVTGHDAPAVASALAGLQVRYVHNDDYRQGLSTSLKAGIRAVPTESDGAIVLLGDMPGVGPPLIDRLIAAFEPEDGRAICVPTFGGKRGNPVLWARRFFSDILALDGDAGGKFLIGANPDAVCEVEAPDDAPLTDIDTPEALATYTGRAT